MTRAAIGCSLIMFLASICFSTTSHAEGFLEMLFGGGRQHVESQSHYGYLPAPTLQRIAHHRSHAGARHKSMKVAHATRRHRSKQHFAHVKFHRPDKAPGFASAVDNGGAEQKCCATAPDAIAKVIHDDPTLRPGDAYMSDQGLRVYVGQRNSAEKFVPIGQASALDRHAKARLAAIENKPVRYESANALIKAPRSGSQPTSRDPGRKLGKSEKTIKMSNGKTIRFVGGYAG